MNTTWVGIDVCKRRLDVAVRPTGELLSFANDETGVKQVTRHLRKLAPQLIVLEATGGHEYAAAYALLQAGLPVAVVNPRQVRSFARAVGKLAKTDPIDANILAHFGEAVQPSVRPIADQQLTEIGQLVTRRRQLVEMLVAEQNRQGASSGLVQRDLAATLRFLQTRLDRIDQEIQKLIRQHPEWSRKAELLDTVPGVGPVLISSIVADLPELGSLNRKQVAALVGVAPSITTAERPKVDGASGAGVRMCAPFCLCVCSPVFVAIQQSRLSINICWSSANRRGLPWLLACESCWSFSTRCYKPSNLGARFRLPVQRLWPSVIVFPWHLTGGCTRGRLPSCGGSRAFSGVGEPTRPGLSRRGNGKRANIKFLAAAG